MQFFSLIMKRLALFVAALLLLGTVGVFALLGTDGGRTVTANMIGSLASSDDLSLEISGLNSVMGDRIEIEQISVADREGVWATAQNLTVSYKLSDLLFGNLQLSEVHLGLLQIDRQPRSASNSAPTTPPAWPTQLLPAPLNTLDVADVKIASIILGPAVAGKSAKLSLFGQASATNSPLRTEGNISVQQLENGNGEIEARWDVNPNAQTAALSLNLSEDRDGIIANLLNIPDRPAITASIEGNGPLADWSSKLEIGFNEKRVISGAAKIALSENGQKIAATLNGQLAPLLPKSLLPLVAGNTDIALIAARDSDGNIQIDKAELVSALAQIQSSGIYSPEENRVDLSANIQIGNEGEVVSFERQANTITRLGALNLSAKINGTINKATLDVEGTLASFQEGEFDLSFGQITATGQNIDIENARGSAKLLAQIETISAGSDVVDQLLSDGLKLQSDFELAENILNISKLGLKNSAISSDFTGRYDLSTGDVQLANTSMVTGAPDTLISQIFGKQAGLIEGEFSLSPDGTISTKNLNVSSANLNASGAASIGASDIEFNGNVRLADVRQFSPELEGALELEANASGNISNPNFQLELVGKDLKVAGKPLDDLKGTIAGSTLDVIELAFNANYETTPIKASAQISAANAGTRKISALLIDVPGAAISGEVSIGNSGLMAGFADLRFEDFSKLAPLILQTSLTGSATGRAELYVENGQQALTLDVNAPSLTYDQTALSKLQVKAQIGNLFGALSPQIDVSLGNAFVAGETFSDSVVSVTNRQGTWPVSIRSTLAGQPLQIDGVVSPNGEKFAINVNTLSATYRAIPVSLSEPVTVNIEGELITLDAPKINVAGGSLSASGSISDQFDMAVRLNELPMAAVENIAKTGLAPIGSISASANITGPSDAPNVIYQIDGRNLSGAPLRDAGLASLNVSGSGSFKENALNTNLNVSGGGLDIAISGSTNIVAQTLNFAVKGVAPFSYVARPLTQSGIVLSGAANINATATGTFAAPNIQGQVSTSEARFTEIASRIRVTNLSGTLLFNGDSARLSDITGTLGKNGKFAANGSLSLRPSDKLQSDFSLTIRNGEYDDGNSISTIFDADLTLTGRLAQTALLSGQINVDRTDIIIPESLPNVVSPVAITHKNASAAVNEQAAGLVTQQGNNAGTAMALNIQVNAPTKIFVRGRGLDAELGGNLTIGGTTAAPNIKGSINMSRGRMEILTKRFDFDTGRMIFAGPADPILDFTATTRDGASTYSIFVRGVASAPEFSFGSSPSLPQDQIVAKLFFGRSLADLSPLQLVQLANAIGTLNGSNSGPGLLDRLRAASGLDDVDIKTNEQGETTVGVGAYLNDRTYINVEKGAGAGSGKVTIDLNITDNITARGETSEDGETKAGVFYEKDY